jgi:hypothetical protein
VKKPISKKLRSKRGASITFALLLFLVCAVIGSVVLAAGTAASGRLSKLTEMDSRYYSVNSAAELLAETLDGQEVTIVREKETVTTAVMEINYRDEEDPGSTEPGGGDSGSGGGDSGSGSGDSGSGSGDSGSGGGDSGGGSEDSGTTYTTQVDGVSLANLSGSDTVDVDGMSLLQREAVKLMFGDAPCNEETAFDQAAFSGLDAAYKQPVTMAISGIEGLGISGMVTLQKDGTLVFELKDSSLTAGDYYGLTVTFLASRTEEPASNAITSSTSEAWSEDRMICTSTTVTTETVTKTSTITWRFSGIKELSASESTGGEAGSGTGG